MSIQPGDSITRNSIPHSPQNTLVVRYADKAYVHAVDSKGREVVIPTACIGPHSSKYTKA